MAWIGGNRFLSMAEMQNNAQMFASYFLAKGWTLNAICGALGNIQAESTINPGIWQNLDPNHSQPWGYGLVQWTPSTKYSDWAGVGWENNGPKQCDRIQYELMNGLQWGATSKYPESFGEFVTSTNTPAYLAQVFLYNYEKPADLNQPARSTNADKWWQFFGEEPPTPTPTLGIPIWLLFKMKGGIK